MMIKEDLRVLKDLAVKYFTGGVVKVRVGGENGQSFFVHKELISARSDFFRNALRDKWKEAEDNNVELESEESEVFALYLQLLYMGNLPVKDTTLNDCTANKSESVRKQYNAEMDILCKLFVLAEMLQDTTTKNIIVDAIVAGCTEERGHGIQYFPNSDKIVTIYDGTPNSSPMRRLLVDLYVENVTSGVYANQKYPYDFLAETLECMIKRRERPKDAKVIIGSDYHEKPNET